MTRTPRTCWRPLATALLLTFGLSFGLTFQSDRYCYAGTCGSHLFPLQARLHVIVWYAWLAVSITVVTLRSRHPLIHQLLKRHVFEDPLPFIGKKLALGAAIVLFWIAALYGIIVGIWWIRLDDYFRERGVQGGVFAGNARLAAIALTGHLCDVTMGMAILPVSRHSALAALMKFQVSTTLTFHMFAAYTLFALVIIHGLLYASWVSVFNSLTDNLRRVYPVLNPTYLYNETWPGDRSSLGVWRASLIFTGIVVSFIMLLMFITTLPPVRKNHFNIFYFTHLLAFGAIVIICLHASTMFYTLAPGLVMWLLDWALRLHELRGGLPGGIRALGKGWYLLSVPLPRSRLHGCAQDSPLSHFYIHHAESSLRELHPFCSTTSLPTQDALTPVNEKDVNVRFLFRKRGNSSQVVVPRAADVDMGDTLARFFRRRKQVPRPQWTNKLAGFVNEDTEQGSGALSTPTSMAKSFTSDSGTSIHGDPVKLRLEGPYYTPTDLSAYGTIVCIVAGTGVSGAIAISGAFKALHHQRSSRFTTESGARASNLIARTNESDVSLQSLELQRSACSGNGQCFDRYKDWQRCIIVWTVREEHYIDLPELTEIPTPGFEFRVHLTGPGRKRLDAPATLDEILHAGPPEKSTAAAGRTWVYISGPNAFISAGEEACKAREAEGVDSYGARWDI